MLRLRRRRSVALAVGLALCTLVTACSGADDEPTPPAVTRTVKPVVLTFGVFGGSDEITAYQRVANTYNAVTTESDVTLQPYATEDDLMDAVESGKVPDVFLVSRRDLAYLSDNLVNRPLSNLLDERGVDFGDGYSRDALEAFSLDRELQCMPYGIAPDVVYYNKRWVDFTKMAARGLPTPNFDPDPTKSPRWSFAMFQAAAEFATRPRRDIRGFYVDATLRGLAPFIYSGGGKVFDDDDQPTSLALSDGGSQDALRTTLQLLRDSRLTLTSEQLASASPVQWFKRGRLAMMVGTRSLVPELRSVPGLDFDVLPMPVLDDDATVGDVTGICLSEKAASITEGADFLVHAISSDSVRQVVQAGYLSPANQSVALSDDFLEPDKLPIHSSVFVSSVRAMVIPPVLRDRQQLADAVDAQVRALITMPVLDPDDIGPLTTAIDEASRAVLDPQSTESPTGSPTESPSESPSDSSSGSSQ